jgi:hypothetical protein
MTQNNFGHFIVVITLRVMIGRKNSEVVSESSLRHIDASYDGRIMLTSNRQHTGLLALTWLPLLGLCWLGMMIVHELGHVLAAWTSGGEVVQVVLHPLSISRTDVDPNPKPLWVVWGGPALGVLLPIAAWGAAEFAKVSWVHLLRFFAGFCLIANGEYIGVGSFDGVGDCGEMLRAGTPFWVLWLFGVSCVMLGLGCWHRQAKHFGWSAESDRPSTKLAITLWLLLLVIVVGESLWSARE